jgi:hypothetical protein
MDMNTTEARRTLQAKLFPQGIPRLWCPTLTHFRAAREPDAARIRAHLAVLAPRVRGILVPGSTGEGWEMSDADIRGLLDLVLDAAEEQGMKVLIGVLKTSVEEMLAGLEAMKGFRGRWIHHLSAEGQRTGAGGDSRWTEAGARARLADGAVSIAAGNAERDERGDGRGARG